MDQSLCTFIKLTPWLSQKHNRSHSQKKLTLYNTYSHKYILMYAAYIWPHIHNVDATELYYLHNSRQPDKSRASLQARNMNEEEKREKNV